MKRKIISRILIVLLAAIMVLPLFANATSVDASSAVDTAWRDYIDHTIVNQGRSPAGQANYKKLKSQIRTEQFRAYLDSKKPITSLASSGIDELRKSVPALFEIYKDCRDEGDFDTAACVDSVVSLVTNIASCFGPYGQLAASVVNLGNAIFKLAMGGEAATSEMAQMEDRLTQQLDDIQNQLSDIENAVNDLSNEINESTNRVINEVTSAIDNADAKAYLRTFMLSGEGNFSYNQYRNYIYGASTGNSRANTAYYALLKQSIANGASREITKYYYDQLYTAIMNDRDAYYDYIVGSDVSKSIVQYYYDVVSANPDLVEKDMSAELMAVMFAYDIYQTEIMACQIISTCNLYQYAYMLVNEVDSYEYDSGNRKIITISDIEGAEGIDSMQERINLRIEEIQEQLVRDIAYILNLDNSYIVETKDGDLFEIENNNPDTYGYILHEQTIYLNIVPQEVCDLFGFDVNDFTYKVSVSTSANGVFYVDSNAQQIEATLYYNEIKLDAISFTVGTNVNNFNGGSGTASDPYLIASAEQFKLIRDGLDKHYRLICDIDFHGETIQSFGQRMNSNDAIVYDEFVGSLDGNGYTVSNLNVEGYTNAGLFGAIGATGEVADLKLYNVKVSANITNAEKSTSEFYAGIISGTNNGIIKYCSVDSDGSSTNDAPNYGLFLVVNNQTKNRNIYVYAGGITGANYYAVAGCTVANSHISASSTHNFGGDATNTNKNNVYVGGICGYSSYAIAYSVVKNSTKITSYAKSVYNPQTTVNPYVVAYAGGIAAKVDSLSGVYQVESSANIIKNDTALDCESNWGRHYKNCSAKKDVYIPSYSEEELKAIFATESIEDFIAKTERNYEVTVECPDVVYEAGSDAFNAGNLKFSINGVEKEYKIIDIYGFDTQNKTFDSVPQNVIVLFSVEIEGETVYFAQDIAITIKENKVISTEVLNLKDAYVTNEFSPVGLVLKYNYAVGAPEYITIEDKDQVKYFGNFTTFGEQDVNIVHNGTSFEFKITVVCGHGSNFTSKESGYTYKEALSKIPTCTEIGYEAYVCGTCGDVKYFYLRKAEHTADLNNIVDPKEVTCTEDGNTGKICCIDCGETLIDGKVIPKLEHNYVYVDENQHSCSSGSHSEFHHYSITESVESKINPDGSESWYIVYVYTCVCKKDGQTFTKKVLDENSIVEENKNLPTIMVSDGYALSGGDEVVVYVQLLNNPGINAANFGIRYPRGLELDVQDGDIQDGTVLKGSLVTDGFEVDYGYNFLWGNDSFFDGNGNLLKLTFTVSEDAKLGDSYEISLVYAMDNGAQGGFGTSKGKKYFITKAGSIKVVERLPGDINNDGIVDLMDAIEIGRFVVGKTDSIDETYANVDLSYNNDGNSNVDIMDMVAILQYITGGYGTNLLTQDFEIILNTNGYDAILEDLLVSVYGDDNNTYAKAGLTELVRQGYKFLGWYDQMFGGNRIDISGDVRYNPKQKKQTLYAQWELNKLVFDITDATSEKISDIVYTDKAENIKVPDEPTREYNVVFCSSEFGKNKLETLTYAFAYFEGSNGARYYTVEEAIGALLNNHYGELQLTAIWDEQSPFITFPEWVQDGYEKTIAWYGDSECSFRNISKAQDILSRATKDGDVYKIYAKHTPIEFSINFDFNGGSGNGYDSLIGRSYTIKSTINLPQVSATKTYNVLNSWDVYIGDTYYGKCQKGSTISGIVVNSANTVVVFKAQWEGQKYTVIYDGNRPNNATYSVSNIPQWETWTYDSNATLPSREPSLTGWTFNGWYRDPDCTTKAGDKGETLTKPNYYEGSNVTLYAKWVQTNATITFNANGGNVSVPSKTVLFDGAYGDFPPEPSRANYAFLGWYTSASGGEKVTSTTKITTSSVTVYAQWLLIKDQWQNLRGQGGGTDQKITDEASYAYYTEVVHFANIDVGKLIDKGYTKIKLRIEFGMLEEYDGWQELYFFEGESETDYINSRNCLLKSSPCYNCADTEKNCGRKEDYIFVLETFDEDKSGDWHTHYFDFEFSTADLLTLDGKFRIGYGANGTKHDDWRLGHTIITVEFINPEEE